MIEEQIATALETVLPDAVYPVVLPRTPTYPAMTYHRRDYEIKADQWSLSGLYKTQAEGSRSLFQVVIYAETYTQCAYLLRQVKTALEGVSGLMLDSINDGYEWQQNVYAIVTEWAIWGDLETPLAPDDQPPPDHWPVLQPFINAMLASLKTEYCERVNTVRLLNPQERQLNTPALVLDVTSIDIGKDRGDDRPPLQLSLSLHCLYPAVQADVMTPVASMAAEVLDFIRFNTWQQGERIDFAENLSASRDTAWPGLYSQWTISWQQTCYPTPEPLPCVDVTDALIAFSPDIGEDHQDDYQSAGEPVCP